jgi:hypothetical protein
MIIGKTDGSFGLELGCLKIQKRQRLPTYERRPDSDKISGY